LAARRVYRQHRRDAGTRLRSAVAVVRRRNVVGVVVESGKDGIADSNFGRRLLGRAIVWRMLRSYRSVMVRERRFERLQLQQSLCKSAHWRDDGPSVRARERTLLMAHCAAPSPTVLSVQEPEPRLQRYVHLPLSLLCPPVTPCGLPDVR